MRAARFGVRALKAAGRRVFRVGQLTRDGLRNMKRDLGFPLRNAMLRGRPLTLRAGSESALLAAEGAVALELWAGGQCKRHELEFLLGTLGPGMTLVDVGANVGLFSMPAAKKIRDVRVYAFEPSGWTYERLVKNAALNHAENVCAVHAALGDCVGEAKLQVNVARKDGLNTLGRPTRENFETAGEESVRVTTLDEFVRENGIGRVDAMKIATEGAELLVLRGAEQLLKREDAPLILYESYSSTTRGFAYHPVETIWLLRKWGFSCFALDSRTGQIREAGAGRAYETMVVAVKPGHAQHGKVRRMAA